MKKIVIEDMTFKIENKEEEKNFIEGIQKMKKILKESYDIPAKFSLFKNVYKNKNIFKLHLVFESEEVYSEFIAKISQEDREKFNDYLGKYEIKYSRLEKNDINNF
ncbi:MAG: hypothetical protein HPAVJP_0670 [Candidatus Hepatoplasma vulgare]|nr:MAG: hypothetical protein HPAVJP_0670 [Candidatus Hepatoplasma sp.]